MNLNLKLLFKTVFLFIFLLLSCKENTSLKLTLLNDSIKIYYPKKDYFINNSILFKQHLDSFKVKIKFKIENQTNYTYVFIPFCFNSWDGGCPTIFSFPEYFSSLDLNNIILFDSKDNPTQIEGFLEKESEKITVYNSVLDSTKNSYYKSLGYENKPFSWLIYNYEITKRMIVIHPNETLFYEVPINMPFNYNSIASLRNQLDIKRGEKYKLQLVFNSKIDSLEKFLTKSQLKTFRKNKYKAYSGKLISTNRVKVSFNN